MKRDVITLQKWVFPVISVHTQGTKYYEPWDGDCSDIYSEKGFAYTSNG